MYKYDEEIKTQSFLHELIAIFIAITLYKFLTIIEQLYLTITLLKTNVNCLEF